MDMTFLSLKKHIKVNKRVDYKAGDTSSDNLTWNIFAKFRINYSNRIENLYADNIKLN